MKSYTYNPLKAPQCLGSMTFAPQEYAVVNKTIATQIQQSGMDMYIEGDDNFKPVFVVNTPAKTPNQIK